MSLPYGWRSVELRRDVLLPRLDAGRNPTSALGEYPTIGCFYSSRTVIGALRLADELGAAVFRIEENHANPVEMSPDNKWDVEYLAPKLHAAEGLTFDGAVHTILDASRWYRSRLRRSRHV